MASEVRLLVCGGRNFTFSTHINEALSIIHARVGIDLLIEGEAAGSDLLARAWAEHNGVQVDPYPADWKLFMERAGPIRNSKMLRMGKPNCGLAFPGGSGTADMVQKLLQASIPVVVGRWGDGPGSFLRWFRY